MSTYKVIQDIETEDKILGPFSLRQFIYIIITALCGWLCYVLIAHHAAFLTPIFLPPILFCGFFAIPWSKEQSTEVWALAKIKFLFKPHRRIWDQSGVKELVTITAPKKIEEQRTNGLSQTEVKSKLSALADTLDSRGWAIKNVNVNLYSQTYTPSAQQATDRLIDVTALPQDVSTYDVQAADDILDERSNPIAQQFDQMIQASSQAHRQQLMDMLNAPEPVASLPQPTARTAAQPTHTPPNDYWFLNQPSTTPQLAPNQATFTPTPVVIPGEDDAAPGVHAAMPTAEEEAVAEKVIAEHHQPEAAYSHLKTIKPLSEQPAVTQAVQTAPQKQPKEKDDALLQQLARNNDLNVATIQRQASKPKNLEGDDEIVIALH